MQNAVVRKLESVEVRVSILAVIPSGPSQWVDFGPTFQHPL